MPADNQVDGREVGTLQIGELAVEPTLDQISRGAERSSLRPQVMDLLIFLATHPGDVVSSDTLLGALWGGKVVTEGTLYNCIAELRKAIAALDNSQPYIETIPKRGYRLVAVVREGERGDSAASVHAAPYRRLPLLLTVVILCAAAAIFAIYRGWQPPEERQGSPNPLRRFTIEMPPGIANFDVQHRPVTISPDGQRIILPGEVENRTQLYSRAIDSIKVLPIKGTEDAASAYALSPNGEWIAFTRRGDTSLHKVRATGGVPIRICDSGGRISGLSWNKPDVIVFDSSVQDGLMSVDADGGEPVRISFPSPGSVHKHPHLLKSGNAVIFTVGTRGATMRDSDTLALLSLDTGLTRLLIPGASPNVTEGGVLIYFRNNALWAARFDADRQEILGASTPVADDVHYDTEAHFTVADNGAIVYVITTNFMQRELVWVDGMGREAVLPLEPRPYLSPRIAPDGSQVAVIVDAPGGADLWVYSLDESMRTRLTNDQSREASPVWQRDGAALIYSSDRIDNLYRRRVDGVDTVEQLVESADYLFAYSTTPDDTKLLYTRVASHVLLGSPADLMSVDLSTKVVAPLGNKRTTNEFEPAASPDGRLLAFSALRDGQREVYVRDFMAPNGASWRISPNGGSQPAWGPRGDELFYWGPKAILLARIGPTGKPTAKAQPFVWHDKYVHYDIRNFDVSPDGRRLLMVRVASSNTLPTNKVVFVQNWLEQVKEKLSALDENR